MNTMIITEISKKKLSEINTIITDEKCEEAFKAGQTN